jgi:hypothetical protein
MSWRWRVWLYGERDPRAVRTENATPLVIYAVAIAMDQARPRNSHESLRAKRVELLDHDGSVLRAWRGP